MASKTHPPAGRRGMVTTDNLDERRRTEPPPILRKRTEPEPEGERRSYDFVSTVRYLIVTITSLGREDADTLRDKPRRDTESADETLTRAAIANEPNGYIRFVDYTYRTPHKSVAAWLDDRIKRGKLRDVARDSAQMRLGCAYPLANGERCPFWVFNTEDGREQLARHILEEHEDEPFTDDSETQGEHDA